MADAEIAEGRDERDPTAAAPGTGNLPPNALERQVGNSGRLLREHKKKAESGPNGPRSTSSCDLLPYH